MLKVQLDAAALDRLIGGDTEIEIKLRQAIVEDFARKYLKAVAITDGFQETLRAIKDVETVAIKAYIGEMQSSWGNKTLVLNPEFEKALRARMLSIVNDMIATDTLRTEVQRIIDEKVAYYTDYINNQVKRAIDTQIADKVQERFNKVIAAATVGAGQ